MGCSPMGRLTTSIAVPRSYLRPYLRCHRHILLHGPPLPIREFVEVAFRVCRIPNPAPLASHIIYFPALEGALCLGTLGKRIMGLEVISEDGSSPARAQFVVRNLDGALDILPVSYLLGIVLMTSDPKRRRFGDRVAHTIVVAPSSRRILVGPMLLVLLVGFLFAPLVYRAPIRPPRFPARPMLEMEVLSQLPIVVEPGGSSRVVLSIETTSHSTTKIQISALSRAFSARSTRPLTPVCGMIPRGISGSSGLRAITTSTAERMSGRSRPKTRARRSHLDWSRDPSAMG